MFRLNGRGICERSPVKSAIMNETTYDFERLSGDFCRSTSIFSALPLGEDMGRKVFGMRRGTFNCGTVSVMARLRPNSIPLRKISTLQCTLVFQVIERLIC